ncbi:MAG TPA: hypothetical protein VKL40_13155 [Candidatus Angelobacter sp.]|nr:hypothetical protein [Candidatus Angelobacter sp.]
MADTVLEQVLAELRKTAITYFPQKGELKNLRVVGHTPKSDHMIYDVCADLVQGNERMAIKVYRPAKCGGNARAVARQETANLEFAYQCMVKKKLGGIPRPLGDSSELGAVVAEKISGLPLQSIIMKAALLPGFADTGSIALAAQRAGQWLRSFHKATADMPEPFDSAALLSGLEKLCRSCREEGLDEASIRVVLDGARAVLARARKTMPSSAVLTDFAPLNVVVTENGVGFCDLARMKRRGNSLDDVANFLASVEALEKYPFCNRAITGQIQESFLEAYGATTPDLAVLRVFKMKALLGMFAHGRVVKDNALRKKIMWATVMKKFIHQAARRSLAPPAAAA